MLDVEEDDFERIENPVVVHNWYRFLRKYIGIRKLQLIFHATSCALKDCCSQEARARLSNIYKKE